jgi:hypothetical protein
MTHANKLHPPISRRDFLKLSGATVGALKLASLAAAYASLTSCGPGFEPTGELPRVGFDRETVIYNGKTVPVNELDFQAMSFYSDTKDRMKRMAAGDSSAATRPAGYAGAPLTPGWVLNQDRSTIMIDQTADGDYVAQALVGRKVAGENPMTGTGGFNDIINDLRSTVKYNEHSLLVVGRGNRALWFDNIESVNNEGRRARIAVDGKKGKIFQILTGTPGVIDKMFRGEQSEMDIGEINLASGEAVFTQVMTPISEGFVGFLLNFLNRLPVEMTPDQRLDTISYFFSGSRFSSFDRDKISQLLGGAADAQNYFDMLNRFRVDIPFDRYELALANSVLAETVKNTLGETFQGVDANNWSQKVKSAMPTGQAMDINVVNNLVAERVSLPKAAPDVYFIQVKNKNEEKKWFAVGRYSVWENDVDRTAWTPLPDGFAVSQNGYWFTYGEISPEVVDSIGLRPHEKVVDGLPFDEVVRADNNQKKPLSGDLSGLYTLSEARRVSKDAIRWGWDPAEGNAKHKINPGFFIKDRNNKGRFLKLILDDTWGTNLENLPELSNRPLPLLGNSPRVIKDVTPEVNALIGNGQETTSPFLLDDYGDISLMANLNEGPNGFLNFDFINANFSPNALQSFKPPGEFFYAGTDNAMLVYSQTPEGQQINISIMDNNSGEKISDIPVTHPIIISPHAVGEFRDGTGYIKVAEDAELGRTYIVREQDIFPLGARSTEKLRAIAVGEAVLTIAALYGGYAVITKAAASKGLIGTILKQLFSKLTH